MELSQSTSQIKMSLAITELFVAEFKSQRRWQTVPQAWNGDGKSPITAVVLAIVYVVVTVGPHVTTTLPDLIFPNPTRAEFGQIRNCKSIWRRICSFFKRSQRKEFCEVLPSTPRNFI